LIVKTSTFDGAHNFIVSFTGEKNSRVVVFSPQGKSISILDVGSSKDLPSLLEIPIDGRIAVKDINGKIPSLLFQSIASLGKPLNNLTVLDAIRLFIFSETVPANNISEKELSPGLNPAQQSTLISLSVNDPAIYQENQSIQIINAADIYGIGGKLAALIENIGGNVVLVSTSDKTEQKSKIVYYGNESYTVKKLSKYLGFTTESSNTVGVADVIITIGQDSAGSGKF
jgi:hypothetical protein